MKISNASKLFACTILEIAMFLYADHILWLGNHINDSIAYACVGLLIGIFGFIFFRGTPKWLKLVSVIVFLGGLYVLGESLHGLFLVKAFEGSNFTF